MTRAPLAQLDDWQLENSDQDLRGRKLLAEDGRVLGTVREMMVDTASEYVDALVLENGAEIPTRYIRIGDDAAYYNPPGEAPADTEDGVGPVATAGREYPADSVYSSTTDVRSTGINHDGGHRPEDEVMIPIIAEEIRVAKRQAEGAGVRVTLRVEEAPVNEQVRLRTERVADVHRERVDRPAADGELEHVQEGSFEIRERTEEAVVAKEARVVEEVVIGKDVSERTAQVKDTVRRMDVDVEELNDRETDF